MENWTQIRFMMYCDVVMYVLTYIFVSVCTKYGRKWEKLATLLSF